MNLNNKYDIKGLFNDGLNTFDPGISYRGLAKEINNPVPDNNSLYGFFDWLSDAKSALYRSVQQGEMQEQQDIMTFNRMTIDSSQNLIDLYSQLEGNQDSEQKIRTEQAILEGVDILKKNGMWTYDNMPTVDDLKQLIKQSQKNYDDAYNSFKHNEDQYYSSLDSYDISQYYNRRSNESVQTWGNFFYTMPATVGTSSTSPFLQSASMAAGWAGAKTGALTGAAIGGGIGAAIGLISGGILGLAGAQVAGGAQSRQYESHMEAFNAYTEKTQKLAQEEGVDIDDIANNVRQQLEQRGERTDGYNNQMLIERLLSDKDLRSGSATFDRISKDSFLGTRAVYEKNNALGAGEAISDLLTVVPAGKFTSKLLKPVGKFGSKLTTSALDNKITRNLAKRFETGVELSKLGSKLRNKVLWENVAGFAMKTGVNMLSEGSEEGAQAIITNEYLNGDYDDYYAHEDSMSGMIDAATEGQMFSDIGENVVRRAKALGGFFNLSSEYKNDQQMTEEIFSGMLLPFFSPQTAVAHTLNAKKAYDKMFKSKRVGDYISEALSTKDVINRNEDLYKLIRRGAGSTRNYNELLDDLQELLLKRDASGKTHRFALDTSVLTEDSSVPSDDDIKKFIQQQKIEYNNLKHLKNKSSNQLKQLNLSAEDEDTFLALKYNALQDVAISENRSRLSNLDSIVNIDSLASDEQFKQFIQKFSSSDDLSQDNYFAAAQYYYNTLLLQELDSLTDANLLQSRVNSILNKNQKVVSFKTLIDGANSLDSILETKQKLEDSIPKQQEKLLKVFDKDGAAENIALATIDPGLEQRIQKSVRIAVNNQVLTAALRHKADAFNSTNQQQIKSYIEQFRNARRDDERIADEANRAARENREPQNIEEINEVPDKKPQNLNSEEVLAEQAAVQETVNSKVDEFKQLIDSIPDDSYLSEIKNKVSRGSSIIGQDNISYARYITKLLNRLKYKYENNTQSENYTDEEREQFKKLKEVTTSLQSQLEKLLQLNAEVKAKAERHNPKFKTDSTVWFDADGNRYTFDMPNAEYSENEGLILQMRQMRGDDYSETQEVIDKLEKRKEAINKDSEKNPDNKEKNDKIISGIDNVIDTIRDVDTKKNIIEVRADNPWLRSLTTKNNLGNEKGFGESLDTKIKSVERKIEQNRNKRLTKADNQVSDGDIYSFDGERTTNKKHMPSVFDKMMSASEDRAALAKAYALDNPDGLKTQSKLMNPFYAAKAWHGSIRMIYRSGDDVRKRFVKQDSGEYYGRLTVGGETYDRAEAVDTFIKIGKIIANGKKNNNFSEDEVFGQLEKLAKKEVNSIKLGNKTISYDEYKNMMYSLPLTALMYQKRTGKQQTRVYLADFASLYRGEKPTSGELDSRFELIHNLLLSFKETKKEVPEPEETEGYSDEQLEDTYSNAVYFGDGSVTLTYGDFDYNVSSERNPDLNIYQNEEGNQMSQSELNDYYTSHISEAIDKVSERIDDLVSILNDIGYTVTKESLLEEKEGTNALTKVIEGVVKYGDGVISRDRTLFPDYLTKYLGRSSSTKGAKESNTIRARRLLNFMQNVTPETFLSYKDQQAINNTTPSVRQAVEQALRYKYFDGEKSIKIFLEGERLDTTFSDENVKKWTEVMRFFEKAITESRNAEEFLELLHSEGYTFELTKQKNAEQLANETLEEYFNNRRFSRLATPSNIVNMITIGSASPMNQKVDYENFNRITVKHQGRIDEVKSLGLVKDSSGRYHFSLEEWEQHNVDTSVEDTNSPKTEFEAIVSELEKGLEKQLAEIDNLKGEGLVEWISSHSNATYGEKIKPLIRVPKTGKNANKTILRYGVKETKAMLKSILQENLTQDKQKAEEAYRQTIRQAIQDDDEFAGMTTMPLTFAYGSYYEENAGSSIIYSDAKGNKTTMRGANGTPGAMYLVMPSFLTSARRQQPIHVNPKKFDVNMATFIAKVYDAIRNGLALDSFADNLDLDGFTVNSTMTVQSLLDSLIFSGKDAILNNPSDSNYEKLLYIDSSDNSVHFGDQTLTDDNFDQFVQFIMDKKTYRIDREKAMNSNATFGDDVDIRMKSESGENISLFSRKENDNYVASIVDDGLLTTDLNQSKSSRLFTKPSVYINYNKKRTFTGIPTDKKSQGTAANARETLSEENKIGADELKEKLNAKKESGDLVEYVKNYLKSVNQWISELHKNKIIPSSGVKIAYFGVKSGKVYGEHANVVVSVLDDGEISVNISGGIKSTPIKKIMAAITKSNKYAGLVLLDENDNFIEQDGKMLLYHTDFSGLKFGGKTSEGSTTSVTASNEVTELKERLAYLEGLIAGMSGKAPQQGTTTVAGTREVVAEQKAAPAVPYKNLNQEQQEEGVQFRKLPAEEDTSGANYVHNQDGSFQFEMEGVSIKLNAKATEKDLESAVLNVMVENEMEDDADFYDNYLSQAKEAFNNKEEQPKKTGVGWNKPPVGGTVASEITGQLKKEQPKQQSVEMPSYTSVIEWAKQKKQDLYNKYNTLANKSVPNSKEIKDSLVAIYVQYYKDKLGINTGIVALTRDLTNSDSILKIVGSVIANRTTDPTNLKIGPTIGFLNNFVQKEDYDAAISRAEEILGKDFPIELFDTVVKTYDLSRQAMIYVYGQCTSSGIRLFRDANNRIAKGSLYHEAFHKISLFILNKNDREKMYQQVRDTNPELTYADNRLIEEYLADRFAEFVNDVEQRKQGKYYSSNPFAKTFQKLFDFIRKQINKLTKFNITPKYTDMNKLFKDMYSGRYAYAKETIQNIEDFDKVYSGYTPYAGYKVSGIELADDAEQYQNIFRDLMGRLVRTVDLTNFKNTDSAFSVNGVKNELSKELKTYTEALEILDSGRSLNKNNQALAKYSQKEISEAIVSLLRITDVYTNVLKNENWKVWSKILEDTFKREFGLDESEDNDPNAILNTAEDAKTDDDFDDTSNHGKADVQSSISSERDSYLVNLWNTTSANMKMLFWGICEFDANKPETAKFTPDGLVKYVDVRKLFRQTIDAISGSTTVEDMLNKLGVAARNNAKNGDYGLMQLWQVLSNEGTNGTILNRFFSDFNRYVHNFENHSYKIEDEKAEVPSYQAEVKNGSMETVTQNLGTRWKQKLTYSLTQIAENLRDREVRDLTKGLKEAITNLSYANKQSVASFLAQLDTLYGIGGITGDYIKDAEIYLKDKTHKALNKLIEVAKSLNLTSKTAFLNITSEKQDSSLNKKVKELFGEKGDLTNISQELSSYVPAQPQTSSQRGPGNTKIYTIGAYNFVTKMIDIAMKTKDWIRKMARNPYSQHSQWLDELIGSNGQLNVKAHTKLQTVLDDNFSEAVADIQTTEIENLVNQFTSILQGRHLIPSLANKRFAADITGFTMFTDVFDKDLVINRKVIDKFVGYLADEILAMSDAMYTRQYFIDRLNKILKPKELYTVDSFSNLSSLEQEQLFKSNKEVADLLKLLVKQYHFTSNVYVNKEKDGSIVRRAFQINLKKGTGYKLRHFTNIPIKLSNEDINTMSEKALADNRDVKQSAQIAYEIANQYRNEVADILYKNIAITIDKFINIGIINGNNPSLETNDVDVASLTNVFLPKNLLTKQRALSITGAINGNDIYKSLGVYTLQGMSDMVEFEKLISGDVGYHKNFTSVNKRYSGIVSTYQITANKGTHRNAFTEDRLFDSETFNTVTLNTSLVMNTTKFEGDMLNVLGVNVVKGYVVDDGSVTAETSPELLLNEEGKFTEQAKEAPLVKRYIEHRNNNRKYGLDENGNPLSDKVLAERIVDNAVTRFINYLNNDPTDASAFISPEMFRQLKQREGAWDDTKEACYNLLEHFDELPIIYRNNSQAFIEMCNTLKVDPNELLDKNQEYIKALRTPNNPKSKKIIDQYVGYIINAASALDATSLKYVYYGNSEGRSDELNVPIYDKQSYMPIFKIFTIGHEMNSVYKFMKKNQVDVIKFETAVKSGGIPSFEAFDQNGKLDMSSFDNSVIQQQYFSYVGKQLNTDPHHTTSASLLTQFMKIAMMNISDNDSYDVGGNKIKGALMKGLYKQILDHLTDVGLQKFRKEFGITATGLDKRKFAHKMQEMAATQGLPADTIEAFDVENGEFIIHPACLPNMRWIQSRLLSAMGKTIIDTTTPGQPLYQVPSFGFDNLFNLKSHPDKHLLMPGELRPDGTVNKRMQVMLSINFFSDVLDEAKKVGVEGYDFNNFADQKRFILENKELFALSYRVPTQGQNSTIPIEIVDLFPPQRGGIVTFPAGITAQTGSDFDIDKMFLARFNYEIKNGKLQKVKYGNLLSVMKNMEKYSPEQIQNLLLDMYQAVLTSKNHYLAANTPLDVCTDPLKKFTQDVMAAHKDGANYEKYAGFHLNPIFHTEQKVKNAGSDNGIGPMALNSVFRFFIQCSDLTLRSSEYLKELGIDKMNMIFDRNGEDILDITSALINAHVDAVKDNYIGQANVNGYTFDVTSFLTTAGFGNDTFAFLTQPILREIAKNWQNYKNGRIGVTEEERSGNNFLESVKEKYVELWKNSPNYDPNVDIYSPATKNEMSVEYLRKQIDDNGSDYAQQLRYLNTFLYFKDLGQGYRDGVTSAQIDTKKYGISSEAIISFIQARDQFASDFNLTFENPEDLFENTFLGEKYNKGVLGMFGTFSNTIFEFSPLYKQFADRLSRQYGKYGRYSKQFLHRVGPKIKTVMFLPFFNDYIRERFPNTSKPLYELTVGANSVPGRYRKIMAKCIVNNEGTSLFTILSYNQIPGQRSPQFFSVNRIINEDPSVKGNVQQAISELFESNDPEVRQWAADFAVYMFYLTGGEDSGTGGLVKTTLYDILPPKHLANIRNSRGTFNEFVQNAVINRKAAPTQQEMDHVISLIALTDDSIVPVVKSSKTMFYNTILGNKNAIVVKKGANKLFINSTGQYSRYVKVKDGNVTTLYQLGDIAYSYSKKTDRYYQNPVYYKVQQLGYRNPKISSYSIRADGYVGEDGKLNSLFNTTSKFNATQRKELQDSDKKYIDRELNASLVIPAVSDYAQFVNDEGVLNKEVSNIDGVRAVIDQVDTVFFINDGYLSYDLSGLKDYCEYKNKEFVVVSSQKDLDKKTNGKKATILGSSQNSAMVESILSSNNNKTFVAYYSDLGEARPSEYGIMDIQNQIVEISTNVGVKTDIISKYKYEKPQSIDKEREGERVKEECKGK